MSPAPLRLLVALMIAVAAGSVAAPGHAQQDREADDPQAGEPPVESEELEQIDEILRADEEVMAGEGYTYDPGDRRDPFVSLLQTTDLEAAAGERPAGIPGLLIGEIELKGIFELRGRYFAQVETHERETSYLLQVGDQLYDGEVVDITVGEVVFQQIVDDPSVVKPFREVVKQLNPEP